MPRGGARKGAARTGAAKKKSRATVAQTSRMGRADFLVREVARTEEDIEGARAVASYTAVVQLRKHLGHLHAELVALRLAEAARTSEAASPEQVMAELRQVVADLPVEALAELEAAIRRRRIRVA